jgi:carbon storage regulator
MLVLSRKTSEVIRVGTNISVTVLAIQGGRVRLGIEAPRDVPVCRAELLHRSFHDEREITTHASCEAMT